MMQQLIPLTTFRVISSKWFPRSAWPMQSFIFLHAVARFCTLLCPPFCHFCTSTSHFMAHAILHVKFFSSLWRHHFKELTMRHQCPFIRLPDPCKKKWHVFRNLLLKRKLVYRRIFAFFPIATQHCHKCLCIVHTFKKI